MPRSLTGHPDLDQGIAGFGAGAISTILLHPLDLIKTRFQVEESRRGVKRAKIGGTFRAFRSILKEEGFQKGLYRGLSPNFAGATTSWGLYFLFYSSIKRRMRSSDSEKLNAGQHLLAAAGAGIVTQFCTNPIWVVKTRMCATAQKETGAYRGLLDGLYQIARYEGIRGLYKGMVPAIFGTSHGAIQFMAYEEMKKWRASLRPHKDPQLDNTEYLAMAASSKMFAIIVTYPYQVIRARLQFQRLERKYEGIGDLIRKMYRIEGTGSFYRGLAPNLLRTLPGTCVTFLAYENLLRIFRAWGTVEI
ncbi:uncharacterized protein VTP21DRAFT_866 [Calcarisporiella thermophila]|uniref:uncharacterized protein n=1 Tax=Calcarisporiella thermophila TaxID=911321 RepID=UPI003744377B